MGVRNRPKIQHLAIVLLILAFIPFFTSCDSMSRSVSVKAKALLSGKVLELPISNTANWGGYAAWGGLTFKSRKSMVKLSAELVDQGTSVITTNITTNAPAQSAILFHSQNDNGTSDDYCIRLIGVDGVNSTYIFSGMEAKVAAEQDKAFSMLLPIHLVSDVRINQSIVAEINLGAEYETFQYWGEEVNIQDVTNAFYSFYDDSGWYNLEKADDYFLIKGYKPGLPVRPGQELDLPSPIKVSFVNHVNLVYFVVTFE